MNYNNLYLQKSGNFLIAIRKICHYKNYSITQNLTLQKFFELRKVLSLFFELIKSRLFFIRNWRPFLKKIWGRDFARKFSPLTEPWTSLKQPCRFGSHWLKSIFLVLKINFMTFLIVLGHKVIFLEWFGFYKQKLLINWNFLKLTGIVNEK